MDERIELLRKYNTWNGNALQTGYLRTEYSEKLASYLGNRLIKVLVGQRRVGKSYILRQIAMGLIKNGINCNNIFFLNKEFSDFDYIKTYKDLDQIISLYKRQLNIVGKIYLFIDEIQNIEGWEYLINSYSQDYVDEYEIFISGSNSKMLSGELATHLSGRYVKFLVLPLSYKEYLGITGKVNLKQNYIDYMQEGGMPELFNLSSFEVKRNYVSALKDTVLLRDIVQRYNIKDAKLLEDIFVYLINNASNILSIRNVTNYFVSNGRKVSYDTVANYIIYLEDACLIHRVERYNIKGKETIAGNCKYYANDLSFNNYLYRGFSYGIGYMVENLVYVDLIRSGFSVYVGTIKDKEVDFVAVKGDRTIYVQVTYMLIDEQTIEREYASLELISDSFEKYVVSLDDITLPSKGGIRNIQAWNFANDILR
jgi:uncharacterized protein